MAFHIFRPLSSVPYLGASLLLVASLLDGQTAITGGISGTVVGDDNQLLQASVVVGGYGTAVGGRASSAANGSFQVSGLSAGNYFLCARVANGAYLDPCSWVINTTPVVVVQGKVTTGVRLVMAKGAPVTVRINVPPNVLGVAAVPGQVAPHILVGFVTPRGLFEPLKTTGQDSAGTNQQGMIPPNTPTTLSVVGKGIQVTDGSGNSVNATGNWTSVTASNSGTGPTIVLNVSKP